MGIKQTAKKIGKVLMGKTIEQGRLYDYSTKESREYTVPYLYEYARAQKSRFTLQFIELDDYYNSKHRTQMEIQNICIEKGIPFIPAVIPDPFIHVESQIIPDLPDFEFRGRDDDLDGAKAKQRQYVVQYVIENNKLDNINTENERQLNKLGNAFWKVAWDAQKEGPGYSGDIVIGNPDASNIFPDPAALELQDCEYLIYSYRMHRLRVARIFAKDLERLKMNVNDINADGRYSDTEIYNSQTHDVNDDTLQVIEHWFKQPNGGSEVQEYTVKGKTVKKMVTWESGDIACSIIIGVTEIHYIPKYWVNTGLQNKFYPFVKYCKIPINKSFWDMSEITPIKDLVDAADREFAMAILNDTFNANDITLMEENALVDDTEAENTPGAIWKVKDGKMGTVARLGGLANLNVGLKDTITFIRDVIKETVGNFDVNQGGGPPANVRTLGGLVELRQQGERRQSLKKADRTAGFELLYELVDWTALEFYDDKRIIFLGAEGDVQEQMQIKTNGMMSQEQQIEFADQQQVQQQQAQQTGQQTPQVQPPNMDRSKGPIVFKFDSSKLNKDGYYPRIDCVVQVGDGITHNKAFTLSAIETIAEMNISVENYKIVCEMIDIMQLPNRKEIKEYLNNFFSNLQLGIPKITAAYKDMSPDAKQQLLAKIGLNIQIPEPMDEYGVPYSMLSTTKPSVRGTNVSGLPYQPGQGPQLPQVSPESQAQMQQSPITPQSQQQGQQVPQVTIKNLLAGLSPAELDHLRKNPHLLDQVMAQIQGGQNAS